MTNTNKLMTKFSMLTLVLSLILVTGAVFTPTTASAYWGRGGWGGGYWHHGWHDGRLGWWWVLGPTSWYYYQRPYVQPQTVIIQQPAPAAQPPMVIQQQPQMAPPVAQAAPPPVQTMYYCKSTETYYPQTMTCPLGWTPVTPGAPPAP